MLPYGEISFRDFNTDRSLTLNQEITMTNAAAAYGISYNTGGTNDLNMQEFWQGQVIFNSYTGCGRGNSSGEVCNDAFNNRLFYSNLGPFQLTPFDYPGGGYVYVDQYPNVLIGYSYVYINNALWNVNNSTGQIISYNEEFQC